MLPMRCLQVTDCELAILEFTSSIEEEDASTC